MKKLKYYSFLPLIIIANIFLFWAVIYLYQSYKLDQMTQKSQALRKLLSSVKIINERWREGDIENSLKKLDFDCPALGKIKNVGQEFTRCNIDYLRCYFNEYYSREKINQNISIKLNFTNINSIIVDLDHKEIEGVGVKIILENNCHETFLPQRSYGHALGRKRERVLSWRFDNFKRYLYIDKFKVSNYEVNQWISLTHQNISTVTSPRLLSSPALHLKPNEMKEYCAERGKQLLTAQLFDAATIHPGNLNKIRPKLSILYPYPWSRNKKNVFLNRLLKEEKVKLDQNMCRRCYTLECKKKFPYIAYDTLSVSWIGIYQVLGGFTEYLENIMNPSQVLMLSSSELPSLSAFHGLGKRSDLNKKPVGFRCVREVIY